MVKVARLPLLGIRLFTAVATMPVSTALVLNRIADAAEVQVALARRLDELGGTVTVLVGTVERSARALEPGMVRLARLLDTDTVEQTVTALPPLLERLQDRLDALQGSLPAFGQVFNPQTVGRVDDLLDRLAAMGPGLTDLHDVEVELRLLQVLVDRLAGLMSETQQSFGSLGTGVAGRRGGSGGEENTAQALAAATAPMMARQPTTAARTPAPVRKEPAELGPEKPVATVVHEPPAGRPKPRQPATQASAGSKARSASGPGSRSGAADPSPSSSGGAESRPRGQGQPRQHG